MREHLDITHHPLLENLLEISLPDGETADLHNDFICERVEYEAGELILGFAAMHDQGEDYNRIVIEFFDAVLTKLVIDSNIPSEALGLGTLERIRCEIDGKLYDEFPDGRVAFLVEFYPTGSLEVIASKVIVAAR